MLEYLNPLNANVTHYIETSQLICIANQLIGFYMRATLAFNGLSEKSTGKEFFVLTVEKNYFLFQYYSLIFKKKYLQIKANET